MPRGRLAIQCWLEPERKSVLHLAKSARAPAIVQPQWHSRAIPLGRRGSCDSVVVTFVDRIRPMRREARNVMDPSNEFRLEI